MLLCPVCLGRTFAGSTHCPSCGAELLVAARGDPEMLPVRTCPRCERSVELSPHWVADTLLEECPGCGGVWLESEAFARLLKSRDEQARLEALGPLHLTIERDAAAPASGRAAREYIPCPDCRQLMNRKNFGECSGVIVDVCRPHGIWFDDGELGRVLKFVVSGGLAEARRREKERLDLELREKRVQAAAIPSAEPLSTDGGPGWFGDLLGGLVDLFR